MRWKRLKSSVEAVTTAVEDDCRVAVLQAVSLLETVWRCNGSGAEWRREVWKKVG